MAKVKTPRLSIWDDNCKPYGTYKGKPGSPSEWKGAFKQMFDTVEEATVELGNDNPLRILGLNFGATIDDIKKAFRKLALKFHPDKGGDESIFRKIMAAYKILVG